MSKEKVVWIVDGESNIRELLTRILEERPYKVIEIANPDEASERLRAGEIPNTISYLTLSGAIQFYKHNQEFLEETSLLIATGTPWEANVEGMQGVRVIGKPFNLIKYVRAIDSLAGEKTVQVGSVTSDVTWGVQISRKLKNEFFADSFFANYDALSGGLELIGAPSALIVDFDNCPDIKKYALDERLKETPILFVAENSYKAQATGCPDVVGKDTSTVIDALEKMIYN